MKTTLIHRITAAALLGFVWTSPAPAQGPGRGKGGGGGPGGGPGEGGFQEAIHRLFASHEKIKRTVELTDTGYKSRTVSDDPEVAKTLQKHVREMRKRLGSGMMIRRWDPAFAELVEHYSEIDHEFKEVSGGVEMIASGKNPEAVKVAQNHARIVSGFVDKGPEQMHATHPRALDAAKNPEAPAAAPACPAECKEKASPKAAVKAACPKCQDKGACDKCEEKPAAKPVAPTAPAK